MSKELEAKQLVPNKFWIVQNYGQKVGTLQKNKEGYVLVTPKDKIHFENVEKVYDAFGHDFFESAVKKNTKDSKVMEVHGYPTSTQAFNPLLDVQNNLPLYSKSRKSKSLYCAGYYIIRFDKGWVKSFCPKLITVERYETHGPYKTDLEMKQELSRVNSIN